MSFVYLPGRVADCTFLGFPPDWQNTAIDIRADLLTIRLNDIFATIHERTEENEL